MLADRYSYIACIPFALLAGGAAIALAGRGRKLAMAVAAAALVALAIQTQRQIRIWHDSRAVWEHAINLDQANALAHVNLAAALASAGENDRAVDLYRRLDAIVQTRKVIWFDRAYLPSARDLEMLATQPTSQHAGGDSIMPGP